MWQLTSEFTLTKSPVLEKELQKEVECMLGTYVLLISRDLSCDWTVLLAAAIFLRTFMQIRCATANLILTAVEVQ